MTDLAKNALRRRLIQALPVGTVAIWSTPTVRTVILPAHAQATGETPPGPGSTGGQIIADGGTYSIYQNGAIRLRPPPVSASYYELGPRATQEGIRFDSSTGLMFDRATGVISGTLTSQLTLGKTYPYLLTAHNARREVLGRWEFTLEVTVAPTTTPMPTTVMPAATAAPGATMAPGVTQAPLTFQDSAGMAVAVDTYTIFWQPQPVGFAVTDVFPDTVNGSDTTLPEATGGTGPYMYDLDPLPSVSHTGITYTAGTRVISGGVMAGLNPADVTLTYTATDSSTPPRMGMLSVVLDNADI